MDPISDFVPRAKIFRSIRGSLQLPPENAPLSATSYIFSRLPNPLPQNPAFIDATTSQSLSFPDLRNVRNLSVNLHLSPLPPSKSPPSISPCSPLVSPSPPPTPPPPPPKSPARLASPAPPSSSPPRPPSPQPHRRHRIRRRGAADRGRTDLNALHGAAFPRVRLLHVPGGGGGRGDGGADGVIRFQRHAGGRREVPGELHAGVAAAGGGAGKVG